MTIRTASTPLTTLAQEKAPAVDFLAINLSVYGELAAAHRLCTC